MKRILHWRWNRDHCKHISYMWANNTAKLSIEYRRVMKILCCSVQTREKKTHSNRHWRCRVCLHSECFGLVLKNQHWIGKRRKRRIKTHRIIHKFEFLIGCCCLPLTMFHTPKYFIKLTSHFISWHMPFSVMLTNSHFIGRQFDVLSYYAFVLVSCLVFTPYRTLWIPYARLVEFHFSINS